MNRIPRTRLVTLMAAAASVTAGLGSSIAAPAHAEARTPASAEMMADTIPAAKPATAAKGAAAPAKNAAPKDAAAKAKGAKTAPSATAKQPNAAAKAVVSPSPTANMGLENDVCVDEADCRNINGGGH